MRVPRVRLDELLVRRGHAPSREKARALVLAGRVSVPGSATAKPGQLVSDNVPLAVVPSEPYVSRGGIKLAHALDTFEVQPEGKICADIGASTGGFADCLLQRGAARVYAIDVGYGQLHWKLRNDPRVVVMERTNARFLQSLPERPALITIDVSFISLRLVLPAAVRVATADAALVVLIKPQFEAGRERVGKGGVVRDPAVHREVLSAFAQWAEQQNLAIEGFAVSPIRGPAGNIEFFAHVLPSGPMRTGEADLEAALAEAAAL
jgi:23S rRNA (cytidine1920-2'-O)/16S rRNA (cytidine1409-2'-O)-methyltransferase